MFTLHLGDVSKHQFNGGGPGRTYCVVKKKNISTRDDVPLVVVVVMDVVVAAPVENIVSIRK